MNKQIYSERLMSIPRPIYDIALNNAAVNNIMAMYANGDIITLEEMLCQMIVRLAKDETWYRREMMDLIAATSRPPFIPKPE